MCVFRIVGVGLLTCVLSGLTTAAGVDGGLVLHKTVRVGEHEVFYREAGDPSKPAILLLHGYPTSSYMFRDLMRELAPDYHLVAPDMPGFGRTTVLPRSQFAYTFENLTNVVERFTEALGLKRYAMYVMDYGAPVGLRLAMRHPERVTALITQNGNAYREGFAEKSWAEIFTYWKSGKQEDREKLRGANSEEGIRWGYVTGVPEALLPRVGPESWVLDSHYLSPPEEQEIQLDLFYDYRTNVEEYARFHDYFRKYQPPLLGVWGKYDPYFVPAGLEAFRRDLPKAELHLIEAGHFALETHYQEVAAYIRAFLKKHKQ